MDSLDDVALSTLRDANVSEALIGTLTREDLKDLFPGPENFFRRKAVWDSCHGDAEDSETIITAVNKSPQPLTSTPVRGIATLSTPQKVVKLSFPDDVVHTDTELEHVRKEYFKLAKKGEEQNCKMSKDLRCRLIRNTMTSMISVPGAKGDAGSDRYPSKPEVTAMAKRIVQYYPMLQDLGKKNTWATVYEELFKRLQNVRSPQKTFPGGRSSKKRRLKPKRIPKSKMTRSEQTTDADEIEVTLSSDSTIIPEPASVGNAATDSAIEERADESAAPQSPRSSSTPSCTHEDDERSSLSDGSFSDEDDLVVDPSFEIRASEDEDGEEEDAEEDAEVEKDAEVEEMDDSEPAPDMVSKSGLKWSPTSEMTLRFCPPAIPRPGITAYASSRISSLGESFTFFVFDEIVEIIVRETNREGRLKNDSWGDTDATEMRAFFGLLLLMGMYRARHESSLSLWGEETGRPIFRATMSRKRFLHLSVHVRFDNRETRRSRDKFAPIREIWELWAERLCLGFNPGEDICVDKQLVGFRGCCSFKQYMPKKPAKYGIKIWVLCDVSTSYCWRMIPYLGKQGGAEGTRRQVGMQVVMALTEGLTGHTVTVDNFFTSFDLAMALQKQKLALVGTMRQNKPEIPGQLLVTKGRHIASSLFAFRPTATMCSYVPKRNKNVLMLSTKHRDKQVSREPHHKPALIMDYNRCKGGVDTMDQLMNTYSCRRKTHRWPMSIFANMLDVSAVNAFILWKQIDPSWNHGKKYQRRLFLYELGKALVQPLIQRRRSLPRNPDAAKLVCSARGEKERASPPPDGPPVRKRYCHLCPSPKPSRTGRSCKNCRQPTCMAHTTVTCNACV